MILLAGPTASGKSGIALALAERLGGAVINADSQQVYSDWRILTARPSTGDETRAPHLLYGHVPLPERYSVGRWLVDCAAALETCRARGLLPIVTGGTGLYFRALTQGLAPVPAIPAEVRVAAEAAHARLGTAGLAALLASRDPETAARLDPANPARLVRALEVLEATGRPLARWQADNAPPLVPRGDARTFALTPPRPALQARIDARFSAMLAGGALDEVARVRRLGLPWSHPGMKALGARELARALNGETSLAEAEDDARRVTRRYAKRQLTWIRGQMRDWTMISEEGPEGALAAILGAL